MTEAQKITAARAANARVREAKFEELRDEAPWDAHDYERFQFLMSLKPDVIYGPAGAIDVKNNGGNLRDAIDAYRNATEEENHHA